MPASVLVARRHGVDLGTVGDGNPGAWNVLEALGPRRAWPAFAGDGLKGLGAGLIGRRLGEGSVAVAYAGVGAAMVGHCFPVFARFHGGKAVMTFAGGAFVLSPPAALLSLGVCVAATIRAGFETGARAGVWSFPVVQLAVEGVGVRDGIRPPAATGALMSIIGLRFLAGRRSARATSGGAAPPPA